MVQRLAIAIPNLNGMDYGSPLDSPISDVYESNEFAELPLTALSKKTRRQLSNLLNSRKILRSEEGYERDWRGIALLAKQQNCCDEILLNGEDPMSKVLNCWCANNPKTATIGYLKIFLGIIDRWDVSDDIYENLVEDAKTYNIALQQKELAVAEENHIAALNNLRDDYTPNPDILTVDDVVLAQKGLPPQQYDAFVLYAKTNTDRNYVTELITKLEDDPQYKFKLCLPERVLGGTLFEHVALTQLIEQRCKYVIVVLTADFLKSPENNFLLNYTHVHQIEKRKIRKIIPLLYDDNLIIPPTLRIYTHLKYNAGASSLCNFWSKLAFSIRDVNLPAETPTPPISYMNGVHSLTVPRTKYASATPPVSLASLPTPPSEIPSININGHAFIPSEDDIPSKIEHYRYEKNPAPQSNHKMSNPHNLVLRNAHSTSQLNNMNSVYYDTNASTSNLSTTSGSSETTKKKKKRWPSKLIKKVFSRSNCKLQESA